MLYKKTHRALSQVSKTSCRKAQWLVGIHPVENPGLVLEAARLLLRALGRTILTFKKSGKKNLKSRCFHNGLSLPLYRDTGQSSWEGRNLSSLPTLSWPQWDLRECRMPSVCAHRVPVPVPSSGWCQLFQMLFTVSKKDCNDIAWM